MMDLRLRFLAFLAALPCAAVTFAGNLTADTEGFRTHVAPVLRKYCADCHGADLQEANLALHDIDADMLKGDELENWRLVEERLRYKEMPPQGEAQPSDKERAAALDWIRGELRKTQAPGVVADAKLLLPAYGNYVDHDALFNEPAGPVIPVAPRLWRMRPDIYEGFANSIAERPDGLSQPFSVMPGEGFKDYAAPYFIDEPATDLLLRNAEAIVENQTSKKYRELMALVDPEQKPGPEEAERAIRYEFRMALQREPTAEELSRFLSLWEKNVKTAGLALGGKATLMAIVMQPEALYRMELGEGEPDELGRVRLSQREIAAAISFALRDRLDNGLTWAAEKGELATREQVQEHVERLLAEDKNPRLMQFFREYFGFPLGLDVFKDKPEQGSHNAGQLVGDLEMLIADILARDENVLSELLTTNRAYVNMRVDKKRGTKSRSRRELGYETIYGLPPDWKWTPDQPIELSPEEHAGVLTHPAWLVAWSGNFDNHPVQRGKWIRTHLLGGTVPDVPIGVDARIPEDEHKTLRERLAMVSRVSECWRCHKKMNPLGTPFEQYDHYGRFRKLEKDRPVDASGAVTRSGDPKLDSEVQTPVELVRRLAKSERVEQVFVRYAFRFFLGRNETLGDAKTLQDAHRAYKENGGSFNALVASLLASESFLYRANRLADTANKQTKAD